MDMKLEQVNPHSCKTYLISSGSQKEAVLIDPVIDHVTDYLEMLQTMLSGRLSDEEAGRRTSALSVTIGEEINLTIPDLEAAEQLGWPVAGPEAYPSAMRVNPGRAIRAPLGWELELLEGCLRAIPEVVDDDDPAPRRIEVSVASGDLELVVSWPDDE